MGDLVYFKNSGEPVSVKAKVLDVVQFSELNPAKVKKILDEYGAKDGISEAEIPRYFEMFKDKRYCLLVFLENPEQITPFQITKKGFGAMSAWISLDDINKIKIN